MKKILIAILIAVPAMAHVPVITPSDTPQGDLPPKLEEKPLPPVVFQCPIIQTPVILLPW